MSRFEVYVEEFREFFKANNVAFGSPKHIWSFVTRVVTEGTFRRDLLSLGNSVLRREGGKVSLTILFTIIGVAIGGIGIAGMGSAVGIPAAALAAVLGSIGFGVGQEIDTAIRSGLSSTGKSGPLEGDSSAPQSLNSSYSNSEDREPETTSFATSNWISEVRFLALIQGLESVDGTMSSVKSELHDRWTQVDLISNKLEVIELSLQTLTSFEKSLSEKIESESAATGRLLQQHASTLNSTIGQQTIFLESLKTRATIFFGVITAFSVATAVLLFEIFEMLKLSNPPRH